MRDTATSLKTSPGPMLILPGTALLYYLSRANYLLFHGLTEMIGVAISVAIAMIAWNTRHLVKNNFLLFIGLGYLFVALLGTLHTFAYKGLSVFPGEPGANLATQLWIAARYLECGTFLVAGHFLKHRLRTGLTLAGYTLVTTLLLAAIFIWPIFPPCFVEGIGLTAFKKFSEYLISATWLLVMLIYLVHRDRFDAPVLRQLLLAVGCNIVAELCFTLYVDVYGLSNFIGHYLRLLAVYFIYRAIIKKSLVEPYTSLFRELNLSEQRYRRIYDTAPLAFVVWDENCRVTQWNAAATRIFGWTADEVMGRNFFEFLVPEEERPSVEEVVAGLRQGTLANKSVNNNLTKSGRTIICAWNNSIVSSDGGRFLEVLSLGLDITEQKTAEEHRRQQSEMIKRFAYSVVHDLKSPAGTLSGLADLLLRRYAGAFDERGRMFCEQIKNVALQIGELVQNINTYIGARELPLKVETVELRELLGLLREEFSARVEQRRLAWTEPDDLPAIRADRLALLRILRNFVDNALKYGGDSLSRIEIGYRKSPTHHLLSIRDDGVGLPPQAENRIYEIFQRGRTANGTTGAGLGLAISRELAEKLGGEVWNEQPAGPGAVFLVSIVDDLTSGEPADPAGAGAEN